MPAIIPPDLLNNLHPDIQQGLKDVATQLGGGASNKELPVGQDGLPTQADAPELPPQADVQANSDVGNVDPSTGSSADSSSQLEGGSSGDEASLLAAADLASQKVDALGKKYDEEQQAKLGLGGKLENVGLSVATGIAKAGFETYDFIAGETPEQSKSEFRKTYERGAKMLANQSTINQVTSDVSQFATGMIGLGKLKYASEAVGLTEALAGTKAGTAIAGAYESSKAIRLGATWGEAAVVGNVVTDPYQQRIGNLIQQVPGMQDSILAFTAANPNDSESVARLKLAAESIGIDAIGSAALAGTMKAWRYFRSGDKVAGNAALDEVAKATPTPPHDGAVEPIGADTWSTSGSAGGELQGHGQAPIQQPKVPSTGELIPDTKGTATAAKPQAVWTAGLGDAHSNFGLTHQVDEHGFIHASETEAERAIREHNITPRSLNEDTGALKDEQLIDTTVQPTRQADGVAGAKSAIGKDGQKAFDGPKSIYFHEHEIADLLDKHIQDMQAIEKYGTRQDAMLAGHQFTPSNVDWSKMGGQDDLKSFIDNITAVKKSEFDAIKGGSVESDATLMEKISQQLQVFDRDPSVMLGNLARAGDQARAMAATYLSGRAVSQKIGQDAYHLLQMIDNGSAGEEKAAIAKLRDLVNMQAQTRAFAESVKSNAARTTRAGRFGQTADELSSMIKMSDDELLNAMRATRGNPDLLDKMANPSFLSKTTQLARTVMINGLLSAYPSHVFNTVGNVMMLGLRPLTMQIGSVAMMPFNSQAAKSLFKQANYEYRYTMSSIFDGLDGGLEALKKGDSSLNPHDMNSYTGGNTTGGTIDVGALPPIKSLADFMGYAHMVIGAPSRIAGAADEVTKTMRYRAVVQAKAAGMADDLGLAGDEWKNYVKKQMDSSFDPSGAGIDPNALREAKKSSFTDELNGAFGKSIQGMVHTMPWMSWVIPFVRSPLKALGMAVRYTPVLNAAHGEYRQAISGALGAEEQARAMGEMAVGTAAFIGTLAGAQNGGYTGGGPKDPASLAWLISKGWKPYSRVSVNADGSKRYTPYGRLDPLGLVMGIAADFVDISSHPDRVVGGSHNGDLNMEGLFASGAIALAKNVTNKTFLMGLNNAISAANDPEQKMAHFAASEMGASIPFSAMLKQANPDDHLREARSILDGAMQRMPGYSTTLAPRYDMLSEPQLVHKGIWATGHFDNVDSELERLISSTGKAIGNVGTSMNGVDLRDVKLADGRTGYQAINEAIEKRGIRKYLSKVIESKAYQNAPDGADIEQKGSKLWMLSGEANKFRNEVKNLVIIKHPELLKAYQQRDIDARGALVLNKHNKQMAAEQQAANPVSQALGSLGINLKGQ